MENFVTTELLLDLVGTVDVSVHTCNFVAIGKFKLKKDGGICSYFGNNFTNWFLKGIGKIEKTITAGTLRYYKLLKPANNLPQKPGQVAIIPELGGEAKAETILLEMIYLLARQENGEDGVLLNNGCANIFYIKDNYDVLRVVLVFWVDGGWDVGAGSVEDPLEWDEGSQVFSRNSVLESSEPSALAQA